MLIDVEDLHQHVNMMDRMRHILKKRCPWSKKWWNCGDAIVIVLVWMLERYLQLYLCLKKNMEFELKESLTEMMTAFLICG